MTNTLTPVKFSGMAKLALAGAAVCGLALSAPAYAKSESGRNYSINIGKDGDLLEQLIEMDREDIDELREEMADARADIIDAIADIEEAREEAKGVPGGGIVLKIAFASARAGVSTAVDEALAEVRVEIDKAERELASADVSDEERIETQDAIDVLRSELDALEGSLDELVAALRA